MSAAALSPEARECLMAIARQIYAEVEALPDTADKQMRIQARICELYQQQFPEDYQRIQHLLQGPEFHPSQP